MLSRQFDVIIERNGEGYYVASVPQLPACASIVYRCLVPG